MRTAQITFDFGPVDFLDSFARSMSWVYEDVYAGPSVMSHMQHYNGYRQWHSVALVESPHTFAAMDSKGIVEIWRYEGCGWKQERVRQRCRVAPYPNGQSSLEWHPSGSYLSMTDNYGKQYRFIRKGWLRKRWQQVPIRTV